MSTVTFDTLEFVNTLKSAGMPAEQAEAVSVAVRKAQANAEVASKDDVRELDTKTEAAIARLDAKMDGIRGELSAQRWMLGFIAASVLSLVVRTFF